MLSLSVRAACSYTRSSCTVHTVLVLQFYSLRLSCHTIIGPPQKRSPQTVHGRIIGVSLTGKEGLISSQLEQPSWTTLPVCTPPSARHRSCIYVVGPSIARVASFPGRFWEGETAWQLPPVQTVTSAARELSPNQISARCHMTTVNRIASCVEQSQSRPIHRNS